MRFFFFGNFCEIWLLVVWDIHKSLLTRGRKRQQPWASFPAGTRAARGRNPTTRPSRPSRTRRGRWPSRRSKTDRTPTKYKTCHVTNFIARPYWIRIRGWKEATSLLFTGVCTDLRGNAVKEECHRQEAREER